MNTTHIARRTRSALALLAGAALLGLAGCGTDTGEDPAPAPPSASTEDDGAQESDEAPSDGGGTTPAQEQDGQDEAEPDEDGTGTAADRTRIMLVTDLGVDDTTGDGALSLPAEDLAALLAEPFDGTADCDGELVLEPGADPVDCEGPESWDDAAQQRDWVANAVLVPHEDGFRSGSRVAVLFSTGSELPAAASSLLDEDTTLTGVGFGSVFGMEPLSAEQLAESTLETLTSEFAYVPVDQMADWSDVSCEDGLDFAVFETVPCEATTADGETWALQVAPGTFADNDQGLLVGIRTPREG